MPMTVALHKKLEELAEAQKQSEKRPNKLERIIGELAEAQKQTEHRLQRLAIAVNQLTHTGQDLIKDHLKTRTQLSGL